MRKFTKKHNDINWLFPKVTEYHNPKQTFDEFEQIGQALLELGYDNQETFTQDDMMDAFMKGASVMNQILGERVAQDKALKQELDRIKAIGMTDEEVAQPEDMLKKIDIAIKIATQRIGCNYSGKAPISQDAQDWHMIYSACYEALTEQERIICSEERERCIKATQDVTCRMCECSCNEEKKYLCPLYSAIHNDIMKGDNNDN